MKVNVITSAKDVTERMIETNDIGFSDNIKSGISKIKVESEKKCQEIIGFGGAFTEAGSTTLDKLSPELRQEAIEAYFHPEKGINYTFCRTHINSCDFSLGNYAYVDDTNDTELKTFSVERDKKSLIPLILDSFQTSGEEVKLFASPWSPPAWMKTNERMNNGGSLKKEHYDTWARYFAKYIKAYSELGINIWGVSIQNEPQATTPWDNCLYSSEEERDFVKVLGPTLEKEGFGNKKIIVWDHNKDIMQERMDVMFSDEEAAKWVWGAGFHWYGHDDAMNLMDNSVLDYTYKKYNTNLVFTEGCNPLHGEKPFIGKWWTGEKYGLNIINDLNHWTTGWCDWNMYLDELGGPNHVGNYCDAPIIADTVQNKLHYNSSYYYIAHFSKYIKPGAVRIELDLDSEVLKSTAAINVNGEIVVVVMNDSEEDLEFQLEIDGKYVVTNSEKRSIKTYVINK